MPWSIKTLLFHDKLVPLSNQRSLGYQKVWVYSGNSDCPHSAVLDVNHMSDETTFNERMPRMLCTVCEHRVPMSARLGLWQNVLGTCSRVRHSSGIPRGANQLTHGPTSGGLFA
jgi:hypothetical protein